MIAPSLSRRRAFTYVELLVILAIILIALAFLLPIRTRMNHGSGRVACSANLRAIGQAMALYANDNKGNFPRTTYIPGAPPTWGTGAALKNPFEAGGPAPNDITAALFLLARLQELPAERFICPNSQEETWDFGARGKTALDWSNFADVEKNLSYSFHNPYPDDAAVSRGVQWDNKLSAEFAVAADKNPGIGATIVTTESDAKQMKRGNTPNHDGDGQNVLYGDGHVTFEQTPFVGPLRDNIYTTKSSSTALTGGPIVASQFDGNDCILLPMKK